MLCNGNTSGGIVSSTRIFWIAIGETFPLSSSVQTETSCSPNGIKSGVGNPGNENLNFNFSVGVQSSAISNKLLKIIVPIPTGTGIPPGSIASKVRGFPV